MTALIVSALVAIAAANAAIWWKWGREVKALMDHQTWQVADLTKKHHQTAGELDAARRAWQACEIENVSLRDRNEMLTHLVGGER